MTKEEFLRLFTDEKTGRIKLPSNYIIGNPTEVDETGVYQEDNGYWCVVKIGIPNPSGIGDARQAKILYRGNSENNAFAVFYSFVVGQENPDDWIINGKSTNDELIDHYHSLSPEIKVKMAFEKDKVKDLLLGRLGYQMPMDKFVGNIAPTDWTIVMPCVYDYSKKYVGAQSTFEQTLFDLIRDNKDRIWVNSFEVYVALSVFYYQMLHETQGQAGFKLNNTDELLSLIQDVLVDKYATLFQSIFWSEIERYGKLLIGYCNMDIFKKHKMKNYLVKLNQFIKPLDAFMHNGMIHCKIDAQTEFILDLSKEPYTFKGTERGSILFENHCDSLDDAKRDFALMLRSALPNKQVDELYANNELDRARLHNYYKKVADLKAYEDIFGEKFTFDDLCTYCNFDPKDIEEFQIRQLVTLDTDSIKLGS